MGARRSVPPVLLALLLVALAATPAWAHASFDVRQLPAGATETFELRVPVEVDAGNEFVDVLVPAGWGVDDCVGATGWSCDTVARDDDATVVNLAREDDGAGDVELFVMALTAPSSQGAYAFPVVQTYDDGREAAWIGEPGGDRPAPVIQVGDDDTPVERSTELPTHGDDEPTPTAAAASPTDAPTSDEATPTPTSSPTDESSPPDEPSPTESVTAVAASAEDDGGVPTVVWVLGAVAVVGVIAAVVVARRRPST